MSVRSLLVWLATAALGVPGAAAADIVAREVTYEIGDQGFTGYYARNTVVSQAPVVLVVHDWDGPTDYERTRARMLAREGYAAFVADLYGTGVRPQTVEQMKARSGELYGDRGLMRERLDAAVAQLEELDGADTAQAVAAGYCFGGSAVLELARSGTAMAGFVSFHGGLATPKSQHYEAVDGPILVLHGSADTVSPMSDVAALAEGLDKAGVRHEMTIYGGAPHAFTDWSSDRYRVTADRRSWDAFLAFLEREVGVPR